MADNVIKAVFASGRRVKTAPLWRYDHGIRLLPIGLELPEHYEMHFSNSKTGEAKTQLADSTGAVIPAEYLIPGTEVYAWIYLVGDTYGRTKAEIIIPVDPKAQPTGQEPTPEQQPVIEQAIDALNAATEDIQGQIDNALQEAKDSGEFDGIDGSSIWWTEGPLYKANDTISTLPSLLFGKNDASIAVGDLVYGPPASDGTSSGSPTFLYRISAIIASAFVHLAEVGSVKGDTGATGPQGAPGLGFPAGGKALHVLRKKTDADYDTEWANPMDLLSDEVKQAILEFAEEAAYAYPTGMAIYTRLYNAFYPPKTVVLLTAVFDQGSTVIYDDTALDDLKLFLTVTAKYDDNTTSILQDSAYTLSGLLEAPSSTVTVLYNGVSTTFSVTVTARPTLSSITAVYTQSGTVYDTDTLDSLKSDLVVTAVYSDSSTQTVPAADYTLSGTLAEGTSTITVSYGGKTTTFSVEVTEAGVLPAGYEAVDYVFSPSESASGPVIDTGVRLSGVGNAIVEISFMDYSTANAYPIGCLSSTSSETVGFGVSIRNDSNKDVIAFTGGTPASISPSPLNSVRIDAVATINSSGISISDGTLLNTQTLTPRAYNVANLYLFGIKKPTTNGVVYPFTGRIYYVRITENDVVLAELLPCIRLADGMAGFWDTVNSRFVYSSELVAAPSGHNTTAEIDQGGKMLVHYTTEPKFRTKNMTNCGVTQKYEMTGGESLVLYPAGIIPTDAISSMYNGGDAAILVVYDENDNPVTYVDEIKQTEFYRWAQNANGTMTEFSQSWSLQTAYSKIAISVDMRYLHDAYMYDKTTGQVWFAGRNTPYYGMSNISEAQ